MKTWAALTAIVLLTTAGACGRSAEEAYLDSVRDALELSAANFKEFSTLFGQVWPVPSAMFDALEQAGAGTAYDETLAAIEKLEPPPRFESDHVTLVAGFRGLASIDSDVGQAVADKDVTAFVLANVAMGQASGRLALRLSPPVCGATYTGEEGAVHRWCERLDEGEGGEYGKELYSLMSRLETDVRPLVGFFAPQFAVEERFALVVQFKPMIVEGVEQVSESVRALNPPVEFQRDHARLLTYLDERLEAARAIPEVPESTPSVRPGPPDGPPPHCVARDDFSETFLRLVVVFFGEQGSDCGVGSGNGGDGPPPPGSSPPTPPTPRRP